MTAQSTPPSTTDPATLTVLPVLRHLLAALQGDNPLAWRIAFQIACERWGEGRGLALAHRAEMFLSAVLHSRPVPVAYSDPLCPDARVVFTEDEMKLLAMLAAMRIDDTPTARELMFDLTGGRVTAAAVQSALSLALLLHGGSEKQIRRGTTPVLKAVS